MKGFIKRTSAVLAVLVMSAAILSAASPKELYSEFSDAVDSGNLSMAIRYYDTLSSKRASELENARKSYDKAIKAGNFEKASEAASEYREIAGYGITREQSEELLSLILADDPSEENLGWLYDNSAYYRPVVHFEAGSTGTGRRFSYSAGFSSRPGTELTLPDESSFPLSSSSLGVLAGWGLTEDEVMYLPGETISFPATDQTYYAVFRSAAVFKDELTGLESTIDVSGAGDEVVLPVLEAPDPSYIFAGWEDRSTGIYIPGDRESYTMESNGAVFEALWEKLEATGLKARSYDISTLPLNTQVSVTLSVSNKGTEDLAPVSVRLYSDDPDLKVIGGEGSIRGMKAGQDADITGIRLVAMKAGSYTVSVELKADGSTWSFSFPVTAE
ncbi:MAG: hypothetical protein SPJ34_02950 [Candidatus Ornithospirochaeta sp.]|nr:hypothetical protein [Candidatus Ornithospirochaeta sp.]